MSHESAMRQAVAAAKRAPALPLGAVLVQRDTGQVVAVGVNRTGDMET
jgi:tRNA(Arg) A34 adenosine deaminase TadA